MYLLEMINADKLETQLETPWRFLYSLAACLEIMLPRGDVPWPLVRLPADTFRPRTKQPVGVTESRGLQKTSLH